MDYHVESSKTSVQYSALPEVTDHDEKDHERYLQEVIHHDDMEPRQKPVSMATGGKSLSLLQIILLNAVVCGVEICACAGFTYIPPMLLKAGYTEENMSIILGMGPLLGFFFVPMIGRASDNCYSGWGRRRPFIIGISTILMFALITIPYGDWISVSVFGPGTVSKTGALLILTVGVVLLDFTSQACLTPCEALLSDASKDTNQQERVFMVYSQMVSLGGFLGYLITALDWNATAIGSMIGGQERTVFTMLVILLLFLLFVTVVVAKEEPLITPQPSQTQDIKPLLDISSSQQVVFNGPAMESGYESSDSDEASLPNVLRKNRSKSRRHKQKFRPILLVCLPFMFVLKRFRILSYVQFYGKLAFAAIRDRLPESIQLLLEVPYVLRKLAVANFCSWTAVMGFNLFFTDFVGQAVYEGNPNAEENSYLRARYDEGVRMGSWGLLFHCITSAVYAFFVENLVERIGIRRTYAAGMIMFTISMAGMVIYRNIYFVNVMAAMTGFGYATLTTIPFILVTQYHAEKEIYFRTENGKNNFRGIGTDIATLDSAYFLSQVILSGMMGYVVHMTGTVLSYMITAGIMGILSCFFIQSIISSREEMIAATRQGHSVVII
ncbi:solute carrier family 45 member 3-like isoform X2 [Ostrea edulis]|uniref:solute carrier family 45 member 3-like isoform X2 n=1 Tax=Ostrea edulis TaxID=37623 RepID=UPI0020947886|nr:solute carrier family 45 member 3-like isoform X2 [Ostrea edulis]